MARGRRPGHHLVRGRPGRARPAPQRRREQGTGTLHFERAYVLLICRINAQDPEAHATGKVYRDSGAYGYS